MGKLNAGLIKPAFSYLLKFVVFLLIMELAARLAFQNEHIRNNVFNTSVFAKKLRYCFSHMPDDTWVNHTYAMYDSVKGWDIKPLCNDSSYYGNKFLQTGAEKRRVHTHQNDSTSKTIYVFGDSFVFGEEVDNDSTFPSLMESKLLHTKVENCGVPGYGMDQMLLKFRETTVTPDIDKILLAFISDDISRAGEEYSFYQKPRFEKDKSGWSLHSNILSQKAFYEKYHYNSKLCLLLVLLADGLFGIEPGSSNPDIDYQLELSAHILSEFKKNAHEKRTQIIVCLIPTPYQLNHPDEHPTYKFFNSKIKSICVQNSIEYIDLSTCIPRGMSNRVEPPLQHWHVDGNAAISNCIVNYLKEERLAN